MDAKIFTVDLTQEDINNLVQFIDIGVKQVGLQSAQVAVLLHAKLSAAREKQINNAPQPYETEPSLTRQ